MKSVFKLLILIFVSLSLLSQSTPISKVEYICTTNGILTGKTFNGLNTLYFQNNKSRYIHNECPKEFSYKESGNIIHVQVGDAEGLAIYMDDSIMVYKDIYLKSPGRDIVLIEPKIKIDWTITNQNQVMNGYNCIKAYGEFGNRTFEIWFTPDIPAPFGPYKLHGLPGLILYAISQDGKVSYKFQSFTPSTDEISEILPPKSTTSMDWSNDEYEIFLLQNLIETEMKTQGTHNDPPSDYLIEKDSKKYISTFKANGYKRNKKDNK